jgi:vacuolar-type H+-ATPase subunit I/STV1
VNFFIQIRAVRNQYPLELLMILIRNFPSALDLQDMANNTPRCYADCLVDHPLSKSALLRPTSCWLQHLRDERVYHEAEEDISEMEVDVDRLCRALTQSLQDEDILESEIVKLESEINSFDDKVQAKAFVDRVTQMQDNVQLSMKVIRKKCNELERQITHIYEEEEKERAFMASFHMDVERIYANANVSLEEMKSELDEILRKIT